MFKSTPPGVPQLAKAKPDKRWGRTLIEGTFRAWYGCTVADSPAQLAKVKWEWEATFDQLPHE
eukprot:5571170-Pleurochrysis_carterae.AAC.1